MEGCHDTYANNKGASMSKNEKLHPPKGWEKVLTGATKKGDQYYNWSKYAFDKIEKKDIGQNVGLFFYVIRKTSNVNMDGNEILKPHTGCKELAEGSVEKWDASQLRKLVHLWLELMKKAGELKLTDHPVILALDETWRDVAVPILNTDYYKNLKDELPRH
jgi:hypothetical protein